MLFPNHLHWEGDVGDDGAVSKTLFLFKTAVVNIHTNMLHTGSRKEVSTKLSFLLTCYDQFDKTQTAKSDVALCLPDTQVNGIFQGISFYSFCFLTASLCICYYSFILTPYQTNLPKASSPPISCILSMVPDTRKCTTRENESQN